MKIDISGLAKEKVITALFNNVYKKSEASLALWHKMPKTKPMPAGFESVPTEEEIREGLVRLNNHVIYIGAVRLGIDFSSNLIDVSEYDTVHDTHKGKVLPASACIKLLQAERFSLPASAATAQPAIFQSRPYCSLFSRSQSPSRASAAAAHDSNIPLLASLFEARGASRVMPSQEVEREITVFIRPAKLGLS